MVDRELKLNYSEHLFLFGARGTGKTTLLKQRFSRDQCLWIDLLTDEDETRFARKPDQLTQVLNETHYVKVIIDEIQKAPKLLDIIHLEIEKKRKTQFIMTGSSARKLKHGSTNLLGGRAFAYSLFPFTHYELGNNFKLTEVLKFGSLPKIFEYNELELKKKYLRDYVRIYLKEEILVEQLIRKINPFKDFLEIAAQMNGKIINYSKIAFDIGVDDKTVKTYYDILEDTLIGYTLPSFHRSIRKQQREASKFYLFDLGVKRALDRTLNVDLLEHTYGFGEAFEHFVVIECFRKNEYQEKDYKLSYFRTKNNLEIDLIIDRPGLPDALVEIKSYKSVDESDANKLTTLVNDWDKPAEAFIWSRDPRARKIGKVSCLPWEQGLAEI